MRFYCVFSNIIVRMFQNVFAAAFFSFQYMRNYYYDKNKIYAFETFAESKIKFNNILLVCDY